MKYTGDYFIGLDIGTDSVGWALTDTNYRILKANQKALWGVRLFDSAETAAERRVFRTNRRRNERKKQRIQWLQMLFDQEICKVDPGFFQRLKESKFAEEDKQGVTGKYTLFADKVFTDKEYHTKYPTIYHLRKALLTEEGLFDVRLVYLALHHMVKNRGHFLLDAELEGENVTFSKAFDALREHLLEQYDIDFVLQDTVEFENHLKDRKFTKTRKKTLLKADAGIGKTDGMLQAIVELLAGSKVPLAKVFQDDNLKNADPAGIALGEEWDEDQLSALLGDGIELLMRVKAVYDWAVLDDILGGCTYLSEAKVASYEKHRSDLVLLKAEIKKAIPEQYAEIFHEEREKLHNYAAYSGKGSYGCTDVEFRKYLAAKLKAIKEPTDQVKGILAELELETFLPKQVTKANSVVPNQVHRKELKAILDRAENYLPFLAEKDRDGISVSEKIISIFDFRIPYYVGPLNKRSTNGWVERTDEKIYPWNFDRVVDQEASAEKFIMRMTSKCTYIKEDVLPKDSLLYSEFMVLNELNNLRINGKRVSPEIKNSIYRELFLKKKTVKRKQLEEHLLKNGICQAGDEISGIDGDFKASMKSYQDFEGILNATGNTAMVEDIIRRIVLFGEDRKMLRSYVERTYGKVLSKDDIRNICKKKYSGWGRLSREFLTQIHHKEMDANVSIIEMLRKTNCNLMEILSGQYTFRDAIKAWNEEHHGAGTKSVKDMVDESYASPAIKRSILQAIGIVDELVKIMGKRPPKRVFVEMARGEEEKKRTVSRRNTLLELYESCKKEAPDLFAQLGDLTDSDLRRDKLYLYYTQMGRCMYSQEPIELSLLDTDYDIDHIYPQSKVKDDSLDNRVLVKRTLNEEKGDKYPIAQEIRSKQRGFWYALKEKGLISVKKYERLTRSTSFAEEELAGFINRQLVETRQSSKIVAEILEKRYGGSTEIVYVKAGNVSDFRQQADRDKDGKQVTYDFVKCREVNDHHHAKDAYLNIVVGNVYHVKFTRNPLNYIKSEEGAKYTLNRLFEKPVERNGETAWIPGDNGSMEVVRKTMRKNNVLVTRKVFEEKGKLFKQTIHKATNGRVPVKGSDPRMKVEKFGGYDDLGPACFFLVEHGKNKKRVRSIEVVFLMYKELYQKNPIAYCETVLGLQEPVVLIAEIKKGTLISYNGFEMSIAARSGGGKGKLYTDITYWNATQLVLPPKWVAYVKTLYKYLAWAETVGDKNKVEERGKINLDNNLMLYDILSEKLKGIFGIMHTKPKKIVCENRDAFSRFGLYEQCKTLSQMILLFKCDAKTADLVSLGGSKYSGVLKKTKNLDLTKTKSMKLIYQSITGVFEQEVDLLGSDFAPRSARR